MTFFSSVTARFCDSDCFGLQVRFDQRQQIGRLVVTAQSRQYRNRRRLDEPRDRARRLSETNGLFSRFIDDDARDFLTARAQHADRRQSVTQGADDRAA